MYGVQNRSYCGVCHTSVLPDNYPNHLKYQGLAIKVMKNHSTNSMVKNTL